MIPDTHEFCLDRALRAIHVVAQVHDEVQEKVFISSELLTRLACELGGGFARAAEPLPLFPRDRVATLGSKPKVRKDVVLS